MPALTLYGAQVGAIQGGGTSCNQDLIAQTAESIYENTLREMDRDAPQPNALTGCLGTLSNIGISLPGFSLSGLLDSLKDQACGMASSAIRSTEGRVIGGANDVVQRNTFDLGPTVRREGSTGEFKPGLGDINLNDSRAQREAEGAARSKTRSTLGNILGR